MLNSGNPGIDFLCQSSMGEEAEEELSFWEMALTIGFAFGLGLLLFVGLPTETAHLLQDKVLELWQNLLEEAIRLYVFLVYILVVSRLKTFSEFSNIMGRA